MARESRVTKLPESVPLPGGHPTARWWMHLNGVGMFLGWPLRQLWRAWHRFGIQIRIRNNVYPISGRHSLSVSISWSAKTRGPRA